MRTKPSLLALAVAVAVNTAALAGLNSAMTDGAQRAQLDQVEPARVVVAAKKMPTETASAAKLRNGSRS